MTSETRGVGERSIAVPSAAASTVLVARGLLFAMLALVPLVPASASERTLVFDPDATTVRFELGAVLHSVHGTARLIEGEIRFDPETGAASGRVVIDARSLETGNASRDEKMHGKVLQSNAFPHIVLEPSGFSGDLTDSGTSEIQLRAVFGLHGDDHAIEFPVTVHPDPSAGAGEAHLEASFSVPYVAWGLKDPSTVFLKVKKEVRVSIEATAVVLP